MTMMVAGRSPTHLLTAMWTSRMVAVCSPRRRVAAANFSAMMLSLMRCAVGRARLSKRAIELVEGGDRGFSDATRLGLVEHELEGGAHGGGGRVGFGDEKAKKMAATAVAGEGVGFASRDAGDRGEDDFQERAIVGGDELGSDHEAVLQVRR